MGRAFYSQKVPPPVVTVCTADSEPPAPVSPYERWSRWNYFDPDSDEFFQNAQREVFTDTQEYSQEQERLRDFVVPDPDPPSPISTDSSLSESPTDRASPMAVGPDDPATMIADTYPSANLQHRFLSPPPEPPATYPPAYISPNPRNASAQDGPVPQTPLRRHNRLRSATVSSAYVAASSFPYSPATTAAPDVPYLTIAPSTPPRSMITTASPVASRLPPSTPNPIFPERPSTPTENMSPSHVQPYPFYTPSPPPSVTPHLYTWNRRTQTLAIPPSPLAAVQAQAGPLGMLNPTARMSLTRGVNVIPTPAPLRIQNSAI